MNIESDLTHARSEFDEHYQLYDDYLRSIRKNDQIYTQSTHHPVFYREYGPHPEIRRRGMHPADTVATALVIFDIDDDIEGLEHTVRQIGKESQAPQGISLETIVGVNYSSTYQMPIAQVFDKYQEIRTRLLAAQQPYMYSNSFQSSLTKIPDREKQGTNPMNHVLRKAMGSIVLNSVQFSRRLSRPIIRFDADTVDIQRGSITNAAKVISAGSAHLVKIPTAFGTLPEKTEARRDAASGVAQIYSITRYLLEKDLGSNDERSYHEESGSGAQLRDWLKILTAWEDYDPEYMSNDGENRIFLELGKKALSQDVPMFHYISPDKGLHATSHRRIRELAYDMKPWEIPFRDDGEQYLLFSELKQHEGRKASPTVSDVKAMIGAMILRHEELTEKSITWSPIEVTMLRSEIEKANFRHRGTIDPHAGISSYWDSDSAAYWIGDIKRLAKQRAGKLLDRQPK